MNLLLFVLWFLLICGTGQLMGRHKYGKRIGLPPAPKEERRALGTGPIRHLMGCLSVTKTNPTYVYTRIRVGVEKVYSLSNSNGNASVLYDALVSRLHPLTLFKVGLNRRGNGGHFLVFSHIDGDGPGAVWTVESLEEDDYHSGSLSECLKWSVSALEEGTYRHEFDKVLEMLEMCRALLFKVERECSGNVAMQ
jgi:hypothetical protein